MIEERLIEEFDDKVASIQKENPHKNSEALRALPYFHLKPMDPNLRNEKTKVQIKRCIHFMQRTGKLPERFSKNRNEVDHYRLISYFRINKEAFSRLPKEAEELERTIESIVGHHYKTLDNIYLLRDFLFDERKLPKSSKEAELYRTLYKLEKGTNYGWVRKSHPKLVRSILNMAKYLRKEA